MDAASISTVVGSVVGIVGLSVAVANMDPAKRDWLWRLWKRGFNIGFYVVLFANSALGFYVFSIAGQPITRGDVLALLLHFFNICSGLVLLFMSVAERALDGRNAKRAGLEAKVKELEAQLSIAAAVPLPRIEGLKALPDGACSTD
jgi:hypothetical protein